MSGRRSRSKGARTERGIVNALRASGIAAVRVPLSGAAGGRFAGDIVLPLLGRDLCVEVKARADGFRELYCWLNERDVLIVKADRHEPLVVVRLSWLSRLPKAEGEKECLPPAFVITAACLVQLQVSDSSRCTRRVLLRGPRRAFGWSRVTS